MLKIINNTNMGIFTDKKKMKKLQEFLPQNQHNRSASMAYTRWGRGILTRDPHNAGSTCRLPRASPAAAASGGEEEEEITNAFTIYTLPNYMYKRHWQECELTRKTRTTTQAFAIIIKRVYEEPQNMNAKRGKRTTKFRLFLCQNKAWTKIILFLKLQNHRGC